MGYTRPDGSFGPTSTQTVTKRFEQRLRGVLERINAAIRTGIIEKDVFGLREESDTLAVDEPNVFETDTNPQKIALFIRWLKTQLNQNFLTVVGPDRNEFIRQAYITGIRNANQQLGDLDISFVPDDMDETVGRPIHVSALKELYTRTYNNLKSVRDDVVDEVRDELVTGFQEGKSPTKIARSLTNRVDSIGKHRSTLIARSEIINAHTKGTLNQIDKANEDEFEGTDQELGVAHGMWDAARDGRVCKLCHALNRVRLTTSEMASTVVTVTSPLPPVPTNPDASSQVGQTFRLAPPAHPQCRCNTSVRVGGTIDTPLEERLPSGISVIT